MQKNTSLSANAQLEDSPRLIRGALDGCVSLIVADGVSADDLTADADLIESWAHDITAACAEASDFAAARIGRVAHRLLSLSLEYRDIATAIESGRRRG